MAKIDGGLRQLLRKHLLYFDWCSIESPITGAGIPDMNYCCDGVEGWLELKQTPGHSVTLRPGQCGWILRRVRNGGRVAILVRQQAPTGPRRSARDSLWLIPGRHAVLARTGGLKALASAPGVLVWHGGPGGGWNWQAIAAALVA